MGQSERCPLCCPLRPLDFQGPRCFSLAGCAASLPYTESLLRKRERLNNDYAHQRTLSDIYHAGRPSSSHQFISNPLDMPHNPGFAPIHTIETPGKRLENHIARLFCCGECAHKVQSTARGAGASCCPQSIRLSSIRSALVRHHSCEQRR